MERAPKNRILRTGLLGFAVFALLISPTVVFAASLGDVLSTLLKPVDAAVSAVGSVILTVAATFTWLAGNLLDLSLTRTVFEMGTEVQGSLKVTIDRLWSLIRDICNLAFIFGFIYIGIRTIIDYDSPSTKRFLSRIIIGALLINFSLFFSKAIIDFSNFTAYQLYQGMVSGTGSISTTLMNQLGVVTIYNSNGAGLSDFINVEKSFSFFILSAIFLFVTAFVFFAGALLLIVRFVALVFIMVASPLLFAATVFPQTEGMSGDLWKKLFSYSFFAPIYILLVLISLKITGELTKINTIDSAGFAQALASGNNLGIILNFIIIIFFMVSSLIIATKLGIAGGNMAVSVGNSLRGYAQSAVGRNTVGRSAHWAREKYEEFDARTRDGRAKFAATKTGKALKWGTRIATFGMSDAIDDRVIRKTLEAGEHAKFGGSYSYEDDEKYDKERKARQGKITELAGFKEKVSRGVDEKGNPLPLSDSQRIEYERAVADASIKDFEELKQEQRKALVGIMTDSQIEALEKSEKLTDSEKHELLTSRQAHVKTMYSAGEVENLSKAGIGHLSTLGYSFLSEEAHAVRLTTSQMDDLKKKMTPTEFKRLSEARDNAFLKLAQGGQIDTFNAQGSTQLNHEFIQKLKPKEVAALSTKALVELATRGNLPVSALESMKKDATKSKPDEQALVNAIHIAKAAGIDVSAHEGFLGSPLGKNFGK